MALAITRIPLRRALLVSISALSQNTRWSDTTQHGSHTLSFLLMLLSASASGEARRQKVNENDARNILYAALQTKGYTKLPGFGLESYPSAHAPEFYFFQAVRYNPGGSASLGHYAVNQWTGDVWDAMGCKRLTSPSVRRFQNAIRKRSGLPAEEYKRLRGKTPAC